MLGPDPDFVTISKMTQLLNIHHIFAKSKSRGKLTATEKKIHGQVMALAIGLTDVYLDRPAYEME